MSDTNCPKIKVLCGNCKKYENYLCHQVFPSPYFSGPGRIVATNKKIVELHQICGKGTEELQNRQNSTLQIVVKSPCRLEARNIPERLSVAFYPVGQTFRYCDACTRTLCMNQCLRSVEHLGSDTKLRTTDQKRCQMKHNTTSGTLAPDIARAHMMENRVTQNENDKNKPEIPKEHKQEAEATNDPSMDLHQPEMSCGVPSCQAPMDSSCPYCHESFCKSCADEHDRKACRKHKICGVLTCDKSRSHTCEHCGTGFCDEDNKGHNRQKCQERETHKVEGKKQPPIKRSSERKGEGKQPKKPRLAKRKSCVVCDHRGDECDPKGWIEECTIGEGDDIGEGGCGVNLCMTCSEGAFCNGKRHWIFYGFSTGNNALFLIIDHKIVAENVDPIEWLMTNVVNESGFNKDDIEEWAHERIECKIAAGDTAEVDHKHTPSTEPVPVAPITKPKPTPQQNEEKAKETEAREKRMRMESGIETCKMLANQVGITLSEATDKRDKTSADGVLKTAAKRQAIDLFQKANVTPTNPPPTNIQSETKSVVSDSRRAAKERAIVQAAVCNPPVHRIELKTICLHLRPSPADDYEFMLLVLNVKGVTSVSSEDARLRDIYMTLFNEGSITKSFLPVDTVRELYL